jgi:oxalate decarboxylase/phosphoglucose isomerase-like protein (cupin superfamily)
MIADTVEEFKAIPVKTGDEVFMPSGFGHLLANIGTTYFATADNSPVDFEDRAPSSFPGHADYKPVKEMQGFAYYIVEHNGASALKKNPHYKEIKKEDLGDLSIIN